MDTVAVIGAGAAGIVAALNACRNHRVILIEGNDKCGKKLLLTGNGRCNYWNADIDVGMYETDSIPTLEQIVTEDNVFAVLKYLESLGIYPNIKGGYYYPYSGQAASVREIFQKKICRSNIEFISGFKAINIKRNGQEFVITSLEGKSIKCHKVILTTGSKAAPKTGSDGSGYDIAKSLGHSINTVCPALSPLISHGKFLKEWEKIRCDARVSLYVNGKLIKEDKGEIQLTSAGISGICTFNISGVAAKNLVYGNKVNVNINFMPHIEEGFYDWFTTRCAVLGNATLEEAMESIFNYKLMFVLLKEAGVSKDDNWFALSEDKKRALCKTIEHFNLDITDTDNFEKAQVCTGGVPLAETEPSTMESRIVPGMYFAGEILDVDGRCGGYNLAFAFISGYIAGRSV